MALTFLEIAQQMADELDFTRPTTLQGSVSTQIRRIKNHINKAYNHVWLKLNPVNEDAQTSTTFTTTQGQDYVAIPTGILNVEEVVHSTEPPLIILPWSEFQQLRADYLIITQTGAPTRAAIYQRRIYLYPTPDSAYTFTVRGKAGLTELSADDDEPALRDEFHRVVLEWALYFSMAYEGNPNLQVQLNNAEQALKTARDNMMNHNDFPPCVRLETEFQDSAYWRYI